MTSIRTCTDGKLAGRRGAHPNVLFFAHSLLVLAVCSGGALPAQRSLSSLPPHTREVVEQLHKLGSLDVDNWKYHPGDLAHGEDVDLDDSSWQSVGHEGAAPRDAVWYRRWFEVPKDLDGYDVTGARIWFEFRVDARGPLTEIVYFNGRRVALGEGLEPIVLFDHANPGERVLVAVKLPETVEEKTFNGASARIEYSSARPDPTRLLEKLISISELEERLGPDAAQARKAVDTAVDAVDLNALHHADQAAFDSSLRKAEGALDPLRPMLQKMTVRLTGQSHIDAAWLWPWTETVDVVRRTFATSLQLMQEYPQYTFSQSAAAYSEWIDEKYPALHDQILKRVKEGRWEMVGGMWVEPDLNLPDGESLVRQLLIGKRYFQQHYGVDVRIGWNPDSFGYNWQLPQIYKKSGVDYFMTTKMMWNETNKLPLKLFWWQSPDGSRVLTYFPNGLGDDINPVSIANELNMANRANPGDDEIMHLYGIGDHGGGPTRAMMDLGLPWTKPDVVSPRMNFGVAQSFFSDVESRLDTEHSPVWNYSALAVGNDKLPQPPAGQISIPIWNDELYLEYHRGIFTTQAKLKQNLRTSEEQLLDAEKYSSLAWLRGAAYPQTAINEAWKKVLFNEFHDLAAGSGIGVIYKDAERDFDQVHATAKEAQESALDLLASDIQTAGPREWKGAGNAASLIVFNSLGWPRTESVEARIELPRPATSVAVVDAQGRPLGAQVLEHKEGSNQFKVLIEARDVPALGYEVLHASGVSDAATRDARSDEVRVQGTTIENAFLRVVLDAKTGCITSLYDKASRFETVAQGGCANQLQTFKDLPRDWDAWNIDADFDKSMTPIETVDSLEITARGPERGAVRITRSWQQSKFVQEIALDAGSHEVRVGSDVDWHETHLLLKAAFPLAASADNATYEIPYGSIERPTTRNNSWESARFEVPALRWGDLGNAEHGFSLINDSKYGYDAKGNTIRLSLLRSPIWPDPQADRGHHHFNYWLYPHSGNWKSALTEHHGYEANYPLLAVLVQEHEGTLPPHHSFAAVTPANVILTAVKKAEDANALLFRVYESEGKPSDVSIQVPAGASSASATNLMERAQPDETVFLASDRVAFKIRPFEIQTIEVKYSPVSPQ